MTDFTINLDSEEQTQKFRTFIKGSINEVLNERDALDHETHKAHHIAIAKMVERQNRRDALYEKAVNSFVGAVVVAAVGALGWVGKIVLEHIDQMVH